jgi:hypothetical protein
MLFSPTFLLVPLLLPNLPYLTYLFVFFFLFPFPKGTLSELAPSVTLQLQGLWLDLKKKIHIRLNPLFDTHNTPLPHASLTDGLQGRQR